MLGVAFSWGKRKGLDVFVEIAKSLDDNYQIILVGTDALIEQKLPKSIITIHRTQNQEELAALYSMADLFVNPTREEVLGMVNVEALACGTPVVTFKTGGCPEIVDDTCGCIVKANDTGTGTITPDATIASSRSFRSSEYSSGSISGILP